MSRESAAHWEAAVFLTTLIAVTLYIFLNPSGGEALHQALIYVMFPFAIWAALRMGQIAAAATVFVISAASPSASPWSWPTTTSTLLSP